MEKILRTRRPRCLITKLQLVLQIRRPPRILELTALCRFPKNRTCKKINFRKNGHPSSNFQKWTFIPDKTIEIKQGLSKS